MTGSSEDLANQDSDTLYATKEHEFVQMMRNHHSTGMLVDGDADARKMETSHSFPDDVGATTAETTTIKPSSTILKSDSVEGSISGSDIASISTNLFKSIKIPTLPAVTCDTPEKVPSKHKIKERALVALKAADEIFEHAVKENCTAIGDDIGRDDLKKRAFLAALGEIGDDEGPWYGTRCAKKKKVLAESKNY